MVQVARHRRRRDRPRRQRDYPQANVPYLRANGVDGAGNPVLPALDAGAPDTRRLTVGIIGAVTAGDPDPGQPGAAWPSLTFSDPVAAVSKEVDQPRRTATPANGEADHRRRTTRFHPARPSGRLDAGEQEAAKNAGLRPDGPDMPAAVDAVYQRPHAPDVRLTGPKPGGGTRAYIQTGEYAATVGQIELTVDTDATGGRRSPARGAIDRRRHRRRPRAPTRASTQVKTDRRRRPRPTRRSSVTSRSAPSRRTSRVPTRLVAPRQAGRGPRLRVDRSATSLPTRCVTASRPTSPSRRPRHHQPRWAARRPDLQGRHGDQPRQHRRRHHLRGGQQRCCRSSTTSRRRRHRCDAQEDPGAAVAARRFAAAVPAPGRLRQRADDLDPRAQPVGQRVTSVRINGAPLDLAKTYTVSTFSSWPPGGDNFTAFNEGKTKDTGLVDRDLWIDGTSRTAQAKSPSATSSAADLRDRSQGAATSPARRRASSSTKLDMNSLGAPKNTKLDLIKVNRDNSKLTFGSVR